MHQLFLRWITCMLPTIQFDVRNHVKCQPGASLAILFTVSNSIPVQGNFQSVRLYNAML